MEETGAVIQLRRALVRVFPSGFSDVTNKKHIAQRSGLELLDEEEIMESIRSMKDRGERILPETMRARRFLAEQLIARGYKRQAIAEMFGVSVKTIYNTLRRIG